MTLLSIDWGSIGIKHCNLYCHFPFLLPYTNSAILLPHAGLVPGRKFYLFFNPWFSLWKKKVDETEYGLGWVPFGGYVKNIRYGR